MDHVAPRSLKWAYSLTMLAAVFPLSAFVSSWVQLVSGDWSILFLGTLFFMALGLYRIFLVARVPGTLDSREPRGIASVFRKLGIAGIYAGAVIAVITVLAGPLTRLLVTQRSDSGIEYFVIGIYVVLLGGIGKLGLVLFEFSRLLAFERHAAAKP
jgi:hypothetical protein